MASYFHYTFNGMKAKPGIQRTVILLDTSMHMFSFVIKDMLSVYINKADLICLSRNKAETPKLITEETINNITFGGGYIINHNHYIEILKSTLEEYNKKIFILDWESSVIEKYHNEFEVISLMHYVVNNIHT